jgi:aconitate hydratase
MEDEMQLNLTQKILKKHLVEGHLKAGEPIALAIDQTLTQDATGTLAALEFEALGLKKVRTQISASYVDHNILQADHKNPDDHRFLQSFAARFGLWFSPPGNGICHQLHMLNFGKPGSTLLGSDSHTVHAGGLAMLAIGAGGLDVAAAMAGEAFHLTCPKVMGIRLTGELPPWVGAKDVILELLRRLTVKGGLGWILEYHGPGLAELNLSQRCAICNMGAELGATTSIFPSDEKTKSFLLSQDREADFVALAADSEAKYDQLLTLDLSELEPLVACPSSPDNVKTARELAGVPVNQIILGSCAHSGYGSLMKAAKNLKGRKVAESTRLHINPGSRQALAQISKNSGLVDLLEAGARLHQSGCLGCIGIGQAPATNTNSLRTFPRNFPGRSGTKNDQVYLAGPEVATASALFGRITDPREIGFDPEIPDPPDIRPDALIPPPKEGGNIKIIRGPNIAPFPELSPLPENLECKVALKLGDNITTDDIMPAGSDILPLRSNIPAISQFVFYNKDKDFAQRTMDCQVCVVVGGENYGQGSSREHAALGPRYLGVRLKLALSFARIHRANLINFGIVPLTFNDPQDYEKLKQGDVIAFTGLARAVRTGEKLITAQVDDNSLTLNLSASLREREILAAGGLLNHIKGNISV